MIRTPDKDTQSLVRSLRPSCLWGQEPHLHTMSLKGGAVLPGVATRRLVPSGFAMRLSRIVERFVSRISVAMPTLPSMIPTEVLAPSVQPELVHYLRSDLFSFILSRLSPLLQRASAYTFSR
jgi:hypothetical protein